MTLWGNSLNILGLEQIVDIGKVPLWCCEIVVHHQPREIREQSINGNKRKEVTTYWYCYTTKLLSMKNLLPRQWQLPGSLY